MVSDEFCGGRDGVLSRERGTLNLPLPVIGDTACFLVKGSSFSSKWNREENQVTDEPPRTGLYLGRWLLDAF